MKPLNGSIVQMVATMAVAAEAGLAEVGAEVVIHTGIGG